MTKSSAGVDDAGPTQDAVEPARRARPWWHYAVPVALVVALVAGAVVGGIGLAKLRGDQRDDDQRQAALTVAQQFTLRLDSLDYKDLTKYKNRVADLLTTKMKTDFTKNYDQFGQVFKAVQITSKGEVRAAGVQDIDQDSATVLVIHDVNVTAKGCVQPPYKRMKVELQKVQGKWLVSDFTEDVPGCQG